MNPKIKFAEQWDKLKPENFTVGTYFTTFRAYDWKKHRYYTSNHGEIFDVIMNNRKIGEAILEDVSYKWSNELSISQIQSDTYKMNTEDDFTNLMIRFYGLPSVFGFFLTFRVVIANTIKTIDDYI